MEGTYEHQDFNEKHGKSLKRALESSELGCNKKRRLHTELNKRSINIVKSSFRNNTFANDRLKRLRNKLSSEVVPVSTTIRSLISKNNCSNVNTLKNRTGNKHTHTSGSLTNLIEDGKSQYNFQSTETSDNHINIESRSRNELISSRHVHHTSDAQDQIQLKADATTVSKSEDAELTSFLDNKCELLLSKTHNNECHDIRELPNSSVHNKLDISLGNIKEKSEITIEMRKSPSHEISSVNICDRTVPSHNNSLNISITNSCLETKKCKISNSLSLLNDISNNKVETKKKCNNVDNDSSLCSCSSSYNEGSLKDSPFSSRQTDIKNKILTVMRSSKEDTLNPLNTMTDNAQKRKPEIFEDSTKYWTNYGEIMDSIYGRFFSSEEEKNDTSSHISNSSNSVSNTHDVNQQNLFTDQDALMEWDDDNVTDDTGQISSPSSSYEKNCLQQEMYIVVDTNIFLNDLDILKDIVSCESSGKTKCILYVPWMVLTELDFMKDDRNTSPKLKRNVSEAVAFINKTLVERGRKLIGQTIFEAEQQKHIGKAPDDKIVSCCIQVKQKNLNVILLSNDVNLKNKLLVNGIPAFSSREMFKNPIIYSSNSNSANGNEMHEKFQKINERMSTCCSYIICECATHAYGKAWNKMGLLKDPPPWTFHVCLKIFKKYWFAVFRDRLLKHCLRTVEHLDRLLEILESSKNADKFNEYVQACLSLCIFLKDLEEHKEFVESTVDDINSIVNFR